MLQIALKRFCPVYACAQEIASLTRKNKMFTPSADADPGLNVRRKGRIVLQASAAGGRAPFDLRRTRGDGRLGLHPAPAMGIW